MSIEIDRRTLLKGGGAVAGSVITYNAVWPWDEVLRVRTERFNPEVPVWAKKDYIRRLNNLAELLPETKGITTQRELYAWALEILPYFTYEGINYQTNFPSDVRFRAYFDGRAAMHVAGQAQCRELGDQGMIFLNYRYANPVSPWFEAESTIPTLVHELTHIQGAGFCKADDEKLEANTQTVTMEIMAAMINHGNLKVLRPFLKEMVVMGLGAVEVDNPEGFEKFRREILRPDPVREARYKKSRRFWADRQEDLKRILTWYSKWPFDAVLGGMREGKIEGIDLPINHRPEWQEGMPEQMKNPEIKHLKCDDLIYLMRNLEPIVREAGKRL